MEEVQELMKQQHACKFCSKSFPCGRSLGGHMRSHITNLSSSAETEDKEKVVGSEAGYGTTINTGYGLRENPKKTWRIADSTGEETSFTLAIERFCRECGKGFHSWKALFGHMKCHSDKQRVSNNLVEDQDSVTNNNAKMVLLDSQSDNEAVAPSKRRRSKRRRARYMVAANINLYSSSLSEVEQEQEEVAMSLIMLSKDLRSWSGINSVDDLSDYNSAYFKTSSSVQTKIEKMKKPMLNCSSEIAKVINQSGKKLEFGSCVSENLNSKGKGSEPLTTELKSEKAKFALEDSEGYRVNGTESVLSKSTITNKYRSIKTKFLGSELKSNSVQNLADKPSEAGEFSKNPHKRGKFECTTCNKIFDSYQALGGHRASHKRNKSCFVSRNERGENSIETQLSPDPTTESKLMKNSVRDYLVEAEVDAAGFGNEVADTVTESKKIKVHKCPICYKVFQSGQALGGHKRSHLASGSDSAKNFQKVVLEEPVREIREFLDLNLPAATEEESTSYADSNRPW
ncbi:hypothetical protein TanjilG_26317 [Lupinus angustifolius]|uniref:C2H2-type domain-containing protein n=1 Tax=Lupinus angustifolius TaxID=3871 RepID=A0A4P1R2T4_LUPAN|nr:PREDICTED: zinc finger protein ZAT4-like [Lupinus angustifolius]OIV99979.1 hypothetical protein TanjilG_26317 [Lupinus angustifolius]